MERNLWRVSICLFIIIGLLSSSVYAEGYHPLRKLARGIVNIVGGWLELPRQIVKTNEELGELAGISLGPLKGMAYTIGRSLVGVYETATFILPPYRPAVEPEFIFSTQEDNLH